jgi:phage terminase small subunit
MPRRSAASFSVLSPTGTPSRLPVPAELTGTARTIFLDTVSSLKPGHFQASDTPLLSEYCRSAALAAQAHAELAAAGAVVASPQGSKPSPWLTVLEKSQRAMGQLSLRLRIGPQGRSPTLPSRPPRELSYHERQALMENGDDAIGS